MLEHLLHVILIASVALGFRSLMKTAFDVDRKPFNCDTCLCGWGSVLGASLMIAWQVDVFTTPIAEILFISAIYPLAATGIAKVALRASRGLALDSVYDSVLQRMNEMTDPPILFDVDDEEGDDEDTESSSE